MAAFALMLLAACNNEDMPNPPREDTCLEEAAPADGKETILLGTTPVDVFVPLKAGDAVTLIHGPQGGQHINVSAKLYALTAGQWQHKFEFIDKETGTLAGGSRDLTTACAPGWTAAHNIRVYIDDDSISEGTLKLQTYLPVELGGSSVSASVEITLDD